MSSESKLLTLLSKQLEHCYAQGYDCTDPEGDYLDDNALSIIRRALEALPDD